MKPCVKKKQHIITWNILILLLIFYVVSNIWYMHQFSLIPPPKQPPILLWRREYYECNFTLLNLTTDFNTLIDRNDFQFLLNNKKCDNVSQLFLIVFVHSAPTHFHQRRLIRSTWGKDRTINNKVIRLVFMIGKVKDHILQNILITEQQHYDDIVQGNFIDNYRNLSYKHIMGFKWILYHCNKVKYILKTDDDIYVDIFQLVDYLTASFGYIPPPNLVACFVIPYPNPKRSQRSKWRVSFKEYKNKTYPAYCSGWSIIMSLDVVFRLYQESFRVPYFWVDDVYVSGILAKRIGIHHVDLTYKVGTTPKRIKQWLNDKNLTRPELFGYADMDMKTIHLLWRKTLLYYNKKGQHIP